MFYPQTSNNQSAQPIDINQRLQPPLETTQAIVSGTDARSPTM